VMRLASSITSSTEFDAQETTTGWKNVVRRYVPPSAVRFANHTPGPGLVFDSPVDLSPARIFDGLAARK